VIRAIAMKEWRLLFASPLAWVVLAFLQLIFAWVFLSRLNAFIEAQPQIAAMPTAPGLTQIVASPVFSTATIILLMVAPLLSMRLVAEERRSQTLPFLISAPVSITQIVFGKFLALFGVLALAVALILLMSLSLLLGAQLDFGLLAANALGLLLLAGAFAAIGLYFSSLTAQPLLAAIGTYALLLFLWLINISATDPGGMVNALSLVEHFESFARGSVAVADVAYYLVLIALFLLLTIRRLDADRLRA
jgi:ABC-2 type transport system permease protein